MMSNIEFHSFVENVCSALKVTSANDPQSIASCRSGEDFEVCVVRAIEATLSAFKMVAKVNHTPGGHAFPDVVIEFSDGSKYGIEVKSSSSSTSRSWKINGNSILGSTREDVIDTYILFGKTALGHQSFRCKRYEDAVANVAVTHSPRYFIDMDIAPCETFFAKSGLGYNKISESQDPIGLITAYFKAKGQRAWWLAENTPAAIRMFSDISVESRNELLGYCFVHFPEVFSSHVNKFSRCAMWLATEHSIVSSSLRDNFSAGGRVEFAAFGRVPRIFDTLEGCKEYILSALDDATIQGLCDDWALKCCPADENSNKLTAWIAVATSNCGTTDVVGYNAKALLCHIMGKQ